MRKISALLSLVLLFALVLAACGQTAAPAAAESREIALDSSAWSFPAPGDNYRVFYEIFTGSFSDSNGDGVGDLRGIMNRMDYLIRRDGLLFRGQPLRHAGGPAGAGGSLP